MSYAMADGLQAALYGVLSGDAALAAAMGDAIYDDVPPGTVPDLYATLGVETARDRSDKTGRMAEHHVSVTVFQSGDGFAAAKAVAGRVVDALTDARPVLTRGVVVDVQFLRAKARFSRANRVRQIEVIFRALVDDDANN